MVGADGTGLALDWQRQPCRTTGLRAAVLVNAAFCMGVWAGLAALVLFLT